jgi:signal transduction histidine kinase/ActR/RegA family two-component response regulator
VRAVLVALAGLALALTASTLFAFALGRRLSQAMDEAVAAAQALGRGEAPAQRPSGIADVERLQHAIGDAHDVLTRERAAREAAEAEREKLLHREQEARELAESQNRAKDEFLAMLGHELRNPLSAITAASALLTAARGDPRLVQSAGDVIGRQSRQLTHIVNDLLDVSRVMSGKVVLSSAPVNLAAEAEHSLATLRASGPAANSRHRITVDAQPVWVHGDVVRIDQVITNLLVNAMKYTPDGGDIAVTVRPQGEQAVLTVRDSGVGIEPELLPRLFEVFVQGTPTLARSQGGLGVGLALVKRLVQLHGGSVVAESGGAGSGSTFTVRLPRIAAPSSALPSPADRVAAPDGRRVLVIDDHVDARESVAAVLALSGIDVTTAGDGVSGLRSATERSFDAAVIDVGLPDIDGYELARRLRAMDATRGMGLVALTGYGSDVDRERALGAGFDRHLTKPAQPEELIEAIETVCRRAGG